MFWETKARVQVLTKSMTADGVRSGMIGIAAMTIVGAGAAGAYSLARPEVSPEQVVSQYVQAALSDRDDRAAAALTCAHPQMAAVLEWRADLVARERRHRLPPVPASVTAYKGAETRQQVRASADIAVTLTVDGVPQERLTRTYRFTLVRDDGWKVCAATLPW